MIELFLISPEQERILRVLEKTRLLTTRQAYRVIKAANARATEHYALNVLRRLQYMQKLRFETEELVALPGMSDISLDRDMLDAVDVMLDISEDNPLEIGGELPPFKLRFLTNDGNRIGSYGVVIVPPDGVSRVNFMLEEVNTVTRTVIFLLSDLGQRDRLTTTQPHYFAVKDGESYRYFKGEHTRKVD